MKNVLPTRWWFPAALVIIALLGACGQKGPLQVPGMGRDTPWPMQVPQTPAPPAAAAPAGVPAGVSPPAPAAAPAAPVQGSEVQGAVGAPRQQ